MGTRLEQTLRSFLEASGHSQKQLAARWHEEMTARGHSASLDTAMSRLSNLMNGDPDEKARRFLEANTVHDSLAAALDITAVRLTEILTSDRRHRTLVLDPRLPRETQDYLSERQASVPDAPFECVFLAENERALRGEELAGALKRTAQTRGAAAIVLLAEDDVAPYLRGADVSVSAVVQGPGRYFVAELPDLIPARRSAPLLHDLKSERGTPLFLCPELAEHLKQARAARQAGYSQQSVDHNLESALKRLAEAEEDGREPTFYWFEVERLLFPKQQQARRSALGSDDSRGAPVDAVWLLAQGGQLEAPLVWTHGRVVYAVGPERELDLVRESTVRCHALLEPKLLDALRRWVAGKNPWRSRGSVEWKALCEAAREEAGLELDQERKGWSGWLSRRAAESNPQLRSESPRPARPDRSREHAQHIRQLLERGVAVTDRQMWLLPLLEQLARADLFRFEDANGDVVGFAHLGEDRVAHVRVVRFRDELADCVQVETRDAVQFDEAAIDGRDVRVFLSLTRHAWLGPPS